MTNDTQLLREKNYDEKLVGVFFFSGGVLTRELFVSDLVILSVEKQELPMSQEIIRTLRD